MGVSPKQKRSASSLRSRCLVYALVLALVLVVMWRLDLLPDWGRGSIPSPGGGSGLTESKRAISDVFVAANTADPAKRTTLLAEALERYGHLRDPEGLYAIAMAKNVQASDIWTKPCGDAGMTGIRT